MARGLMDRHALLKAEIPDLHKGLSTVEDQGPHMGMVGFTMAVLDSNRWYGMAMVAVVVAKVIALGAELSVVVVAEALALGAELSVVAVAEVLALGAELSAWGAWGGAFRAHPMAATTDGLWLLKIRTFSPRELGT